MKRGFLKAKAPASTSAVVKTAPKVDTTVETPKPPKRTLVKIPSEPVITFDYPLISQDALVAKISKAKLSYHITLLPSPTPYSIDPRSLCILYTGTKEKVLELPGFPGPSIISQFPGGTELRAIPPGTNGSGFGLFANRDLTPGDLVAIDRPLLVVPLPMLYIKGASMHPRDMLDMAITKLDPVSHELFFKLANCKGPELSQALGIVESNAIRLGRFPGLEAEYGGVFDMVSRFNHSCAPNAVARWDLANFVLRVRATRAIAAGEQVCIPYVDVLRPRAERRAELQAKYAFACACAACALPAPKTVLSDKRRALLASANLQRAGDADVVAWVRAVGLPDDHVSGTFGKLWDAMVAEGAFVEEVWPGVVQRLCKAACALGDFEGARQWALRGQKLAVAFTGGDLGWGAVYEDPRRTAWWELRVKAKERAAMEEATLSVD